MTLALHLKWNCYSKWLISVRDLLIGISVENLLTKDKSCLIIKHVTSLVSNVQVANEHGTCHGVKEEHISSGGEINDVSGKFLQEFMLTPRLRSVWSGNCDLQAILAENNLQDSIKIIYSRHFSDIPGKLPLRPSAVSSL